jgi:hypothetical protein
VQDPTLGASLREGVWDAVAVACSCTATRNLVALSDVVVSLLAAVALGRGSQAPERVAALHALSSCLGARALGPEGTHGDALLSEEVCLWAYICWDAATCKGMTWIFQTWIFLANLHKLAV